jgi:hypothetical protein
MTLSCSPLEISHIVGHAIGEERRSCDGILDKPRRDGDKEVHKNDTVPEQTVFVPNSEKEEPG